MSNDTYTPSSGVSFPNKFVDGSALFIFRRKIDHGVWKRKEVGCARN
jgi:hypothetical protein